MKYVYTHQLPPKGYPTPTLLPCTAPTPSTSSTKELLICFVSSLWVSLHFLSVHANEITHSVFVCMYFVLPCIIMLRFIHLLDVLISCSFLLMGRFSWWVNYILFIWSLANRHLGSFYIKAIVSKVAIYTCVWFFSVDTLSFLSNTRNAMCDGKLF